MTELVSCFETWVGIDRKTAMKQREGGGGSGGVHFHKIQGFCSNLWNSQFCTCGRGKFEISEISQFRTSGIANFELVE